MNIHFVNTCFRKRFSYLAIILILLLPAISIDTNVCAHPVHNTKEGAPLYKKQADPRLFLIAVIDSEDDSIGERCKTDLDEVKFAFGGFANWLGAGLIEPKIIDGDKFGKAAVNDAIDNWLKNKQPSRTDIVVFYYSGHGFRYPSDTGNYPRMWLKNGKDRNAAANNLQIKEDVYDRIIKMGAGVNLVVSDCCNTTAPGDNVDFDNITVPNRKREVHQREHPGSEEKADGDTDNGDKLFIPDQPLNILATAAGRGELAGGKAEGGGFFTRYFLEALDKCIYEEELKPDWQTIFKYADEKASYWARSAPCPKAKHNKQGRCSQTAEIKIESGN